MEIPETMDLSKIWWPSVRPYLLLPAFQYALWGNPDRSRSAVKNIGLGSWSYSSRMQIQLWTPMKKPVILLHHGTDVVRHVDQKHPFNGHVVLTGHEAKSNRTR